MGERYRNNQRHGFTLIELSIVLVIIGLVVGGVLVGQNLITAAAVRAQISQIDKYNQAVNTFKGKYGFLPGDIPDPSASQFGFLSRGSASNKDGMGNGDGFLAGVTVTNGGPGAVYGVSMATGEIPMLWVDLSAAHLIDGNFSTASPWNQPIATITAATTPSLAAYFPDAKIGRGNSVYIWSNYPIGTFGTGSPVAAGEQGANYFGLEAMSSLTANGQASAVPALTVAEAAAMDRKIDDGYPQSGRVLAMYVGAGGSAPMFTGPANTNAFSGSPTTCYDNGGQSGQQLYSVGQNSGAGVNCALSFKFQ